MRTIAIVLGVCTLFGCATTSSGPSWRGSERVVRPDEKDDLKEQPVVVRHAPPPTVASEPTAIAAADPSPPAPSEPAPAAAPRKGRRHRR